MATLKNLTINDTGFLRLPSGTTAQRPASPVAGQIRYNTTIAANEFYNGSSWITVVEPTVGTASSGGAITTAGGFRIHTFTSGSATFTPAQNGVVDVLVIGGGGSGQGLGGGGGAGGYIYVQGVPVVGGTAYPTVVGTGGAAGSGHGPNGNQGNNSVFGSGTPVGITATGGGGGTGYYVPGPGPVNAGGSGGGGSGYSFRSETFQFAGSGIVGQGHPGGYGAHYNGTPVGTHYGGGGGGGAGTQGYNRAGTLGQARGGEGQSSSITGSVVWRGGGGAGGAHSVGTHGAASKGGKGGGGDSGLANGGNQPIMNGVANTGGGGSGANYPDNGTNSTGGPGVVIVRYRG
jgi:hypothetical protein